MSQEKATTQGMNRAKLYQLILFPMNNGATNVYYILTLNFIAYYANGVLGLLLIFATTMVTVMRLFDAVTDPIIGALIDRTSTKFGKFRPFMVLGNVIMIVSSICLYFGTRIISGEMCIRDRTGDSAENDCSISECCLSELPARWQYGTAESRVRWRVILQFPDCSPGKKVHIQAGH